MPIDQKIVLDQIDDAIGKFKQASSRAEFKDHSDLPRNEITELITILAATIKRLSPPGSQYGENAKAVLKKYGEDHPFSIALLVGVLNALRSDYVAGHLQTIHELIHAELFGDFLEMAAYLLEEGYKDPAAVIAGGVLEEHLRQLCQKNNIGVMKETRYKNAESLNMELAGAKVYSKLDLKSVTAWLDLRNKAAHGRYSEYTKDQVALMVQGIRDFLTRYPA